MLLLCSHNLTLKTEMVQADPIMNG